MHLRILFVGKRENLHQIYADCPDSSSESAAELAFGADWILENCPPRSTEEFTKENLELYQQVTNPDMWAYCFDIRDTKAFGDFGWVNIKEQMEEEVGPNRMEKEERNKLRIIEAIKALPDDTVFFFADSHW